MSNNKRNPRRNSTRGATEGSKKNADEGKQPPTTKGTEAAPFQGSVPPQGETGASTPNYPLREQGAPSPSLPQTLRHLELRRRLGQNKSFLPALERALTKARGRLAAHPQDWKQARENKESQCMVWLLEDSIQKVKAGTYHLR